MTNRIDSGTAAALAESLAAALNAGSWPMAFTAGTAELLDSELSESDSLCVTIAPGAWEYRRVNRRAWRRAVHLTLEVRRRVDALADAVPLARLADEIAGYLLDRPLTIVPTAGGPAERWSHTALVRRRDEEILRLDHLFRETLDLTYARIPIF